MFVMWLCQPRSTEASIDREQRLSSLAMRRGGGGAPPQQQQHAGGGAGRGQHAAGGGSSGSSNLKNAATHHAPSGSATSSHHHRRASTRQQSTHDTRIPHTSRCLPPTTYMHTVVFSAHVRVCRVANQVQNCHSRASHARRHASRDRTLLDTADWHSICRCTYLLLLIVLLLA